MWVYKMSYIYNYKYLKSVHDLALFKNESQDIQLCEP